MEPDIDLGIDPYKLNKTESRLITLLLTLLKSPQGLSLERLRVVMPSHYENENIGSDQKKVHRDIEELSKLGFPALYDREAKSYRILNDTPESKLRFTDEELKFISLSLINRINDDGYSEEYYSLSQKIFGSNLRLYPNFQKKDIVAKDESKEEAIFDTVLFAIKARVSLQIQYERKFGLPSSKEIDPIQILRKNSTDLYLYAYDRSIREYRHYLIPCIKKAEKLDINFSRDHKPNADMSPLHQLQFPVETEKEVTITMTAEGSGILENYLQTIPFTKEGLRFQFKVTNPKAIFPFLIKQSWAIAKLEPDSLRDEYKKFLKEVEALHQAV
jgi:predicted DNA-binding transcriptional regulator YafY